MSTHKTLARQLRAELIQLGHPISHSHALELVAALHGLPDWNTLAARPGTPRLSAEAARAALLSALPRVGVILTPTQRMHVDLLRGGPLLGQAHQAVPTMTQPLTPPAPVPAASMDPLTFRAARPVSIFGLPKPASFTPWQPPFAITPQVSVSRDDWSLGDWNEVDELDEEGGNRTADKLQGLAENLDDWGPDLDVTLPGLTAWARERHFRVDAQALLDWVYADGREGVLMFSIALNGRDVEGHLRHVSFHPERWISGLWSFGHTWTDAEADALRQVRAYWGENLPEETA